MIVDMRHGKLDLCWEKESSKILKLKGLATDPGPSPRKMKQKKGMLLCNKKTKNGYNSIKGFCLDCQRKLITEIELSAYCVT